MMKHGYFLVVDCGVVKRAYVLAFDTNDDLTVMLPRKGCSVFWCPSRKVAEASARDLNEKFRKEVQG